jgi:hypothetical protein
MRVRLASLLTSKQSSPIAVAAPTPGAPPSPAPAWGGASGASPPSAGHTPCLRSIQVGLWALSCAFEQSDGPSPGSPPNRPRRLGVLRAHPPHVCGCVDVLLLGESVCLVGSLPA